MMRVGIILTNVAFIDFHGYRATYNSRRRVVCTPRRYRLTPSISGKPRIVTAYSYSTHEDEHIYIYTLINRIENKLDPSV